MMKYALAGLLIAIASPTYAADPVPGIPPIRGLAVGDPIPGCVGKVCGGTGVVTDPIPGCQGPVCGSTFTISENKSSVTGKVIIHDIPITKKIDVSSPGL